MAISALTIALDRGYYSRFEQNRDTITVTVVPTGSGEDVRVSLKRKTLAGVKTLATATQASAAAPFTKTFDLSTLVDASGFALGIMSRAVEDYTVVAEVLPAATIAATATCTVLLVTPERMRQRWCLGLPLYTVEVLAPRTQPVLVTGVTIAAVGRRSPTGVGTLVWTFSTKTLTWRNGAAVVISTTAFQSYTLVDSTGAGYLVVDVDPTKLAGADRTETLFIDYGFMQDSEIAAGIIGAVNRIERFDLLLEPNRVVTRHLADPAYVPVPATEYDLLVDGIPWYKPGDAYRWLSLRLPVNQVHKVHGLSGWMNRSRVTDIPDDWIVVTPMTGFVELVPSNIATVQWYYYGPWMPSLMLMGGSIPQFWQFDVVAGLQEPPPPALIEHLAKLAAIDILTAAGQARYPAGVTGYSLSRDGVSESKSLMPGTYAATVRQYLDDTGQGQNRRAWSTADWAENLRGPAMVIW